MPRRNRKRRRIGRFRDRGVATSDGCTCLFCGDPLDFSRLAGVSGALADGENVSRRAGEIVYIDLCGVPVPAIVAGPRSPAARHGFQLLFLLCSDECAKAICLASALDHILAGREPPPASAEAIFGLRLTKRSARVGPQFEKAMELLLPLLTEIAPGAAERLTAAVGPDLIDPPPCGTDSAPTREQQEWAQMAMGGRCAWCFQAIPDDAPVTALYVKLQGNDDRALREGGLVTIRVGGRRLPIHMPAPGSPASATGDAAFMLCSDACVSALTAAIEEDRRLSILH